MTVSGASITDDGIKVENDSQVIVPRAASSYLNSYHETEKARWHKYDSPFRHMVELEKACPPKTTEGKTADETVAYAYCTLDSPVKKESKALISYGNGLAVYINGNLLFDNIGKAGEKPGNHEIMIPLEEGRNHLLLKFNKGSVDWDFSFRLEGEEVRNHKQKYYIQ